LATNGVFSAITGLVLAASATHVAGWIGAQPVILLRLVGVGLLGFAALLIWLAFAARRPQPFALVASFADFGWVAVTISLAAMAPDSLNLQGWLIAGGVAVVVLACGTTQIIGIDQSYRLPTRPGWLTLWFEFSADAPASAIWRVVRSVDTIHKHADSFADAAIVEAESDAHGPVRECRDVRGRSWREVLTIDDERMRLVAHFQTERPGFPFPFRKMEGGWIVATLTEGAKVRVGWDVVPRLRWTAFMVMPLLEIMLRPSFRKTVTRMSEATLAESSATATETTIDG